MLKSCLALLSIIVSTACSGHHDPAHPRDLTGRWVRLRDDHTWGDTMEFRADGSLAGSTGYSIPKVLTWRIERAPNGGPARYCTKFGTVDGFCREYRLNGDTLELLGGTHGSTFFRRVR